jgi:hypothetical protein
MGEALGLAFRVALDGALAWVLAALLLRRHGARRLVAPAAAALAAGLAIGAAAFAVAHARGLALAELAPAFRRLTHLHGLLLLAAGLAVRGADAAAPFARRRGLAEGALLALLLPFLLPSGLHLASQLRDAAVLRGSALAVGAGALCGVTLAAALGWGLAWAWERAGFALALTPASLFALLFAVAMAGIGPTALGTHTLPAALTGAVGRALHDGVHLAFVTFQVPDHPFLRDSAYQFILFAFAPTTHALAAIAVLGAPLLLAAAAFHRRTPPEPPASVRAPGRRLLRAAFLRERGAVGAAFALSLLLLGAAVRAEEARGDALYDPLPEPAVEDGAGNVVVPLASPLGGGDDRMRKFVFSSDGRAITFFAVRRSDGELAVALDLCEICQPKGYAQMGRDYVFCKYCKTPIPVGTVGQPGGCNPIPVPETQVKGSLLVIPRAALATAWQKGMVDKR